MVVVVVVIVVVVEVVVVAAAAAAVVVGLYFIVNSLSLENLQYLGRVYLVREICMLGDRDYLHHKVFFEILRANTCTRSTKKTSMMDLFFSPILPASN